MQGSSERAIRGAVIRMALGWSITRFIGTQLDHNGAATADYEQNEKLMNDTVKR